MSEMIERVARAIGGVGYPMEESPTPEDFGKMARAAIEAMREPTKAMINHIREDYDLDSVGIAEEWRAMIDRALKD